jgi:peptide/nickel transport system substrate-binding protein
MTIRVLSAVLATLIIMAPVVRAAEVIVASAAGPTTIDPHHFAHPPNNEISAHLFEALVDYDERNRPAPGLATAWRPTSPTTWEFTLREGVRFHDGSAFTAADVLFSIERARRSTGPSPFSQYVRDIAGAEAMGDHGLRLTTRAPFPLLIAYLARVPIVARSIGDAATGDFDRGRAAIGTGPFQLVEFVPGERTVIRRFERYWGPKPAFERAVFRVMPNASAREAALLAGDVHVLDTPSSASLNRLRQDPNLTLAETDGQTIVYLGFNQTADAHPGIQGASDRNPFKDVRVRQAVSLALDRVGLVQRMLRGAGTPAGQLVYPGADGYSEALVAKPADLDGARRLLAEAGYANGFRLSLSVPNDRFTNAVEVGNAVAAMLSRVGIRTTVDAQPTSVWRDRVAKGEFAAFLNSYGNPFPDASAPLRAITGTPSRQTGFGTQNFGGYANPTQNQMLLDSFTMTDLPARTRLLEKISELTFGDVAVAPLYWEQVSVAMRRSVGTPAVRSDGRIQIRDFRTP